nr:hypothetical protein [Tanacetum cinerariifolium]
MTRSSTKELFTPFKDPKRDFRSSRKYFKTLSLDESRSPDFDLFSDQEEYSEEEVTKTMAETMEQYMRKTRADYGSGIARPKIEDKDSFELEGQFLKELRDNTFSGSLSTSQNPQNVAFVSPNSTNNTSITNEADSTAYGVSTAHIQGYTSVSPAVEDFVNSSKMIENQENVKSRSDKGYHAVPPHYTRNYIPPKPDLMFIDEQVKKTKLVKKNSFSPLIIKDWNSDDESEVEFEPKVEVKTIRPCIEKIKFVKTAREKVEKVETLKQHKHYPRGNQRN